MSEPRSPVCAPCLVGRVTALPAENHLCTGRGHGSDEPCACCGTPQGETS